MLNTDKKPQTLSDDEYSSFYTCDQIESPENDRKRNSRSSQQELVILTSINARNLRICRVNCLNCCPNSTLEIYSDAYLYLSILQFILGLIIVAMVLVNGKILYEFMTIDGEDLLTYVKESCHASLAALSLALINVLTLLLIYYDCLQAQKASARLNDLLFVLLIWSGGWPSAWLLVYLFNYRIYYSDESILVKPKKTVFLVLTGLSIPIMLLSFSNNNITQV